MTLIPDNLRLPLRTWVRAHTMGIPDPARVRILGPMIFRTLKHPSWQDYLHLYHLYLSAFITLEDAKAIFDDNHTR